jgi:hypothetical protein
LTVFLLVFPVTRHGTFGYSMFTRVEMAKVAARMAADRPLLGVGPSQFYALFPRYASPELLEAFKDATGVVITRENAHNQFLQVAAELGAVGLGTFLLALGLAFRTSGPALQRQRPATLAAVGTFLLTCLAGHPLLIPMVAYSFWMAVGIAAADAAPPPPGLAKAVGRGGPVVALLLLATVPVRWGYERADAELTGVSDGLSQWQRDEDGARFRWAGERSAFYVSRDVGLIRVPLRSPDEPRRVDILLDGRLAAGVIVPAGEWMETRLLLPMSDEAPAFRRLDLIVRTDDGGDARDSDRKRLMVGRPVELPRAVR